MTTKKKGAAKAAKKSSAKKSTAKANTTPMPGRKAGEEAPKPSRTNAEVRKAEAEAINKAAGTPPTAAERKSFLSKFIGELTARPDAQGKIIKDSLPSLSRFFGGDIPEVDMNVREHASAPAPGPMTRNQVVDPHTLVNADARQPLEVGAPAGGTEAEAITALGAAQDAGKSKK